MEMGFTVVTLNDGHAYDQLHNLLTYNGWGCHRHEREEPRSN